MKRYYYTEMVLEILYSVALFVTVPPPIVYTALTPEPYLVGQLFEVTCFSNVVEGLSINEVEISFEKDGNTIDSNSRITVGSIRYENVSLFSRTITISQLVGSDTGNYTCRSSIKGQHVYSNETILTGSFVVEGGKYCK